MKHTNIKIMKKTILTIATVAIALTTFSSCNTTKVYHGSVNAETPLTASVSQRNDILLWGLLSLDNSKQEASKFVKDKKNFEVQTQQTFVNGLLSFITLGIYCPNTTTYSFPIEK